jgi:hypothetical protein
MPREKRREMDNRSPSIPPRPILVSLALIALTIPLGIAIRRLPLGLAPVVTKYGGSMLWALMVYWLVSTFLPRWRLPAVATLSAIVATAVEFFKLLHTPALDAFRLTLPGILLLGRFFSLWDLLAYYVAIALAATLLDPALRRTS